MNSRDARNILLLYRPGIDDHDPQFVEALRCVARDPQLKAWFEQQRRSDGALREKLREIEVPAELAERIVHRQASTARKWNVPQWLQLAAAIILLAGLAFFWWRPQPRNNLAAYENYLTHLLSRGYRMSLESDNHARIRKFLDGNQAPADYELTKPLEQTRALGCATLSWNGNPVSMLCFANRATNAKIFLFVASDRAVPNAPRDRAIEIHAQGEFSTASWARAGKIYVLTMKGKPTELQNYL